MLRLTIDPRDYLAQKVATVEGAIRDRLEAAGFDFTRPIAVDDNIDGTKTFRQEGEARETHTC